MADFVERKVAGLTVEIDRRTCIGSANCVKVEPGLFRLDDEGIVSFGAGADVASREGVIEACSVCPVEALRVRDESGATIVP